MAAISLPGGKRKYFYGDTEAEALANRRDADAKQREGVDLLAADPRLDAFLDVWLETIEPSVRPSTYRSYKGHVENYLKPTLGSVRLSALSAPDVQRLIAKLSRQKLAPRTVQYARAVLRMALEQAVKWGMTPRNVAKLVEVPRITTKITVEPSADRLNAVLAATKDHRLEAAFWTAARLGLRMAELLALQWSDLDEKNQTLAVTKSLQKINGVYEFVEPKTTRSRRKLDVPDGLMAMLTAHRDRQALERAAFAQRDDRNLIFCSRHGTPLDGPNVTHQFQTLLAKKKLPHMRMHDLRHACLSLLIAQGVDVVTVAGIAGHSQVSLTLNTYSHVVPGKTREALRLLDDLLASADSSD